MLITGLIFFIWNVLSYDSLCFSMNLILCELYSVQKFLLLASTSRGVYHSVWVDLSQIKNRTVHPGLQQMQTEVLLLFLLLLLLLPKQEGAFGLEIVQLG